MSTATETVDKILADAKVRFTVAGGNLTKRDDWKCYAWGVNLHKEDGTGFDTSYYTGTAHVEPQKNWQKRLDFKAVPKAPNAADVLYCLLSDGRASDQSFDDWCGDLGESNDSMKALATYQACCKTSKQLRSVFTSHELAALETALQDF
jgi:hypothetical protein